MVAHFKYLIYIDIILIVGVLIFRWSLKPSFRDVIGNKQVALILLTPVVAMFVGNAYVFDSYLAAVIAMTSRTRREVLATYLLMLPLVPALDIETAAGGVYLFNINTIISMNFGAIAGVVLTPKIKTLSMQSIDICALLFLFVEFCIIFRDGVFNVTIIARSLIVVLGTYGVPYFVASRCLGNRRDLDRAVLQFLMAGVLCAIVAIFQATRHWVLYEEFNQALNVPLPFGSASLALRGGLLRTGGTMIDYTAGGLFLACELAIFPTMHSRFRPQWLVAICGLLMGGLIVTQSRGAWVALVAGWVVCMIYRGYFARAAALAGSLALAQFALIPMLATFSTKLGESLGTHGQSAETIEYRSNLLKDGLQQIASHPLFGQAPAQLSASMSDLTQGQHIVDFVNTHLTVALVTGLPGLVIWAIVWGAPIALAWRNRPLQRSRDTSDPAEMSVAIIVTAMVCLVFTSAIDRNLVWPIVALGLLGPCLAIRRVPMIKERRSMPTSADRLSMLGVS